MCIRDSSEFNNYKYKNIEKIKQSIDNHTDLFDRNFEYEKVVIDSSFPKYIIENKDQLKSWII